MSETMANLKKAGGGSGKTPVLKTVNLGTGTSINIKNHEVLGAFYDKLTIDNFYQKFADHSSGSELPTGSLSVNNSVSISKYFTKGTFSYNAQTGVLTSGNATIKVKANQGGSPGSTSGTSTTTAYCVYIDYE